MRYTSKLYFYFVLFSIFFNTFGSMIHKEQEFYALLLDKLKKDMESKNLNPARLLKNPYIVSRTQYYNIEKISEGDKNTSRLSHKRCLKLCDYLGIEINEFLFDVNL